MGRRRQSLVFQPIVGTPLILRGSTLVAYRCVALVGSRYTPLRVPIHFVEVDRMNQASTSHPRRGFYSTRRGFMNGQISRRMSSETSARVPAMNPAGVDQISVLSTTAEASGVTTVDGACHGLGTEVEEPKLVVFSGGTAFNSVAAGTLWPFEVVDVDLNGKQGVQCPPRFFLP